MKIVLRMMLTIMIRPLRLVPNYSVTVPIAWGGFGNVGR